MEFDLSIDIGRHPDVYEPSEDSYLMLNVLEVEPGDRLLEMGAGTGIIALHAARAGAVVTAADINPHAVECARRNATRNGLELHVVLSDLFERIEGTFDTIVFNPPYLDGDSATTNWAEKAWAGGGDGSEVTTRFLEDAWRHLGPNGRVYMILSSLGGLRNVLMAARDRYTAEMLEERHMFFESMFAYRFVPRMLASDK
jgi:release factor glutamine methyltransferase